MYLRLEFRGQFCLEQKISGYRQVFQRLVTMMGDEEVVVSATSAELQEIQLKAVWEKPFEAEVNYPLMQGLESPEKQLKAVGEILLEAKEKYPQMQRLQQMPHMQQQWPIS